MSAADGDAAAADARDVRVVNGSACRLGSSEYFGFAGRRRTVIFRGRKIADLHGRQT